MAWQCRYELRSRHDSGAVEALGRYYLEKQFYTGFPFEMELETVEALFAGQATSLPNRLQGEVIDNSHPGAWGAITLGGRSGGFACYPKFLSYPVRFFPRRTKHQRGWRYPLTLTVTAVVFAMTRLPVTISMFSREI
jgi:hypothetical protein